jgi:tRNA G18 (ribose-2'-O)-methylase SpoU
MDDRNVIDEMKNLDNERIKLIRDGRSLPYAILINNVKGSLNTGVIIRNANFYGAREVYYYGDKHWNRVPAVGSYKYLTIKYIDNLESILALKNTYNFVGVEIGQNKKTYNLCNYRPKSNNLYIFGNEGLGISKEILDICNQFVKIDNSVRTVRSLNVSVCSGIVLNHHLDNVDKPLNRLLNRLF